MQVVLSERFITKGGVTMKLRQAKKIVHGRHTSFKRRLELRPPYTVITEDGSLQTIYPSHHDIDMVARAMTVYRRHLKHNKKKWQREETCM